MLISWYPGCHISIWPTQLLLGASEVHPGQFGSPSQSKTEKDNTYTEGTIRVLAFLPLDDSANHNTPVQHSFCMLKKRPPPPYSSKEVTSVRYFYQRNRIQGHRSCHCSHTNLHRTIKHFNCLPDYWPHNSDININLCRCGNWKTEKPSV